MGSNSQHHEIVGEDRISNLPPSLIGHILSFLPIKDALRTCILSTGWRERWTSITRLVFDDYILRPTRFVSFVYYVLLFLKAERLDEFLLFLDRAGIYDEIHINTWTSAAISRNVRCFELHVELYDRPMLLPHCLYTCTSLEELCLGRSFILRVPSFVSLVRLKSLHLHQVLFLDDASFSRLVLGCPVLQELFIGGSLGREVRVINLSSPAIKKFVIRLGGLDKDCNYEIVLNTPCLQHLELDNILIPKIYLVENLPCLDTALFCSKYGHELVRDFGGDDYLVFKTMSDLAAGMSNVRFLHLSNVACEALGHSSCNLPKFPRLTGVKIDGATSVGLRLLKAFIEISPQLATLSLGSMDVTLSGSKRSEVNDEQQTSHVPYSVLVDVEVIEVNDFLWKEVELEMVRYFLEQSKCLKKLTISTYFFFQGQQDRETILKFPRSSKSCEVEFRSNMSGFFLKCDGLKKHPDLPRKCRI